MSLRPLWRLLLALPIAAWELSLGLWMTFKGFRPAEITTTTTTTPILEPLSPAYAAA